VWLYDPASSTWEKVLYDYSFAAGQIGCYDSKRDRMYAANTYSAGMGVAYFDFSSNTWTKVSSGGLDFNSANRVAINYDSANDRIIRHSFTASGSSRTFGYVNVYNPATDQWSSLPNTFPSTTYTSYGGLHTYYDSRLNIHFVFIAGDGSDIKTTMLAYRYKVNPATPVVSGGKGGALEATVFPNPVNHRAVIRITGDRTAEIKILNITGKVVHRSTADPGQLAAGITWNPSGLPAGIYLLRIKMADKTFIKRILVQK
jgi:hypothetical protein